MGEKCSSFKMPVTAPDKGLMLSERGPKGYIPHAQFLPEEK